MAEQSSGKNRDLTWFAYTLAHTQASGVHEFNEHLLIDKRRRAGQRVLGGREEFPEHAIWVKRPHKPELARWLTRMSGMAK